MGWFFFACLSVVCGACHNALSKKALEQVDRYVLSFSWLLFALPFLIPLFLKADAPNCSTKFWLVLCLMGIAFVSATMLYLSGLKRCDLSACVPLFSFGPLFVVLTGPWITGEFPSIAGLTGILLVVAGSYILAIRGLNQGLLGPFALLLSNPGLRLVLGAAVIWGLTPNFHRIGIETSSRLTWPLALVVAQLVLMLPIVMLKSERPLKQISQNFSTLLITGFFAAMSLTFMITAIDLTLVPYVIAVRRAGAAIASILFGYLVFKEGEFVPRLAGSTVMATGVVVITLG